MVDKNEKKREFFEAKKIIEENIENHDDADANETQRFEAKCPNVIFLLCVIEQVISDYKEFQLLKKEGASPLKPPNQETFVNFSQKLVEGAEPPPACPLLLFYLRNINFLSHFRPSFENCSAIDRERWCDGAMSYILKLQNTIRLFAIAVDISVHFEEKNHDTFFWEIL